jgi:hypothetical protein
VLEICDVLQNSFSRLDIPCGDSQDFSKKKYSKGKIRILDCSAILSRAGKIVSYWKLQLAKLKGRRMSSNILALRKRDAGIPTHPPLDVDGVRDEISSSRKYLSEVRSNHEELRMSHLECRALAIDSADHRDPNTSKTLQNLIQDECSLQRYEKIKYIIGNKQGSKISKCIVHHEPMVPASNVCTDWDIEQDEERMSSRKEFQFAQSDNTPLAGGRLGEELVHDGTSKAAQEVIWGEWKSDYPLK